jgi:hypothetical protein
MPKPLVIKFKNIPAASFISTLKELGRGNKLGEGLAKMPLALNEASNAVVVIAPPEVAEYLSTIAKGLDTPNEFRAAQREAAAKDADQRLKIDTERKKAGLPVEPAPAMRPQASNPGMVGEGPRGRGYGRMEGRGPGAMGPMGGMMQRQGSGMTERGWMGGGMRGPAQPQMEGRGPGAMGPMGGMMQRQGSGMMERGGQGEGPRGPAERGWVGGGMRGPMGQGMERRGPPAAEEARPPAPGKLPPAAPGKAPAAPEEKSKTSATPA